MIFSFQRAKQIRQFKAEVSVKELLDLYDDPERHFLDISNHTSVTYRRNSLKQLTKDYDQLEGRIISEVFSLPTAQLIRHWT
jgi:hypothetical protein